MFFAVLIFKIKNDFKGISNEPDFVFLSDILFLRPYKLLQFVGESLGQHQSVDDHDSVRRKHRCSKRCNESQHATRESFTETNCNTKLQILFESYRPVDDIALGASN